MDTGLLRAIASEAARRLTEQEIHRVSHLGSWRYLLRFATPDHDNLLIAVRPDLPRLHLLPRGGGHREAAPDRFAALADRELAGARLTALEAVPGDRVVRLSFRAPRALGPAVARHLIAELFGRSANLLLLDDAGIVLGCARDLESAFRAPVEGQPYQPPRPFAGAGSMPGAGARSEEEAAPEPGTTFVLSRRPLQDYREGDRLDREAIRVVAGTMPPAAADAAGAPLCMAVFPGPSAAAAAAYGLLERLRDFEAARDHHRAIVRRERARLASLSVKLAADLERARGADRHRRWAEALLAGLRAARVEGEAAIVPDPESIEGATLTVPVNPGLSLQANAERHFGLWKKGRRGVTAITTRAEAVRRRLEEWTLLEPRAATVASAEDLEALRRAMDALGMVHAAPRPKRAPAPARHEEPTRVRKHTTGDGFVVLVGRSGPENDTLTFRVASPWDFWMHAAGLPGAHVIVRNPARLKAIPERTLRDAAGIAAWYSGARGEGKVEVHYTQRKHVHKRKGMPAGQVLVRHFRSIQVVPRLPQPALEEV